MNFAGSTVIVEFDPESIEPVTLKNSVMEIGYDLIIDPDMAAMFESYWAEIGVNLAINVLEPAAYNASFDNATFAFVIVALCSGVKAVFAPFTIICVQRSKIVGGEPFFCEISKRIIFEPHPYKQLHSQPSWLNQRVWIW